MFDNRSIRSLLATPSVACLRVRCFFTSKSVTQVSVYAPRRQLQDANLILILGVIVCILYLAGGLHAQPIPDLLGQARKQFGPEAEATVRDWETLIRSGRDQSIDEQLKQANRFFNERVLWVSDREAWNTEDYWATPLETMGKAIGDCEDFTIAKYATLLLMGVDPASLRLIYVKAKRGGLTQAHMVLAWYATPTTTPLILDNMESSILSANERGDLFPVFSFNANALWVGNKTAPSSANPVDRLSRWRNVLSRMRAEGFALGA